MPWAVWPPIVRPTGVHPAGNILAVLDADKGDGGGATMKPFSVFPVRLPVNVWLLHDDFGTIFSPKHKHTQT